MSAAEKVLERLQRVRQTAPDRWIAACPAHEDHSPSLSIRDVNDRVLLHCFGGCATGNVLAALGLQLSDLYDRPLEHYREPSRSRVPATDILLAIDHEIVTAAIIIETAMTYPLSELARDRLSLAVQRIDSAAAYVGGLA